MPNFELQFLLSDKFYAAFRAALSHEYTSKGPHFDFLGEKDPLRLYLKQQQKKTNKKIWSKRRQLPEPIWKRILQSRFSFWVPSSKIRLLPAVPL